MMDVGYFLSGYIIVPTFILSKNMFQFALIFILLLEGLTFINLFPYDYMYVQYIILQEYIYIIEYQNIILKNYWKCRTK